MVENAVILELKCVVRVLPVHEAQLLSYMKLAGKKFGLIINFHSSVVSRSIVRRVL